MFCPACGREISDIDEFCRFCGRAVAPIRLQPQPGGEQSSSVANESVGDPRSRVAGSKAGGSQTERRGASRPARKWVIRAAAILVALLFGWHLLQAFLVSRKLEAFSGTGSEEGPVQFSVNPLTDAVTVKLASSEDEANLFSAIGDSIAVAAARPYVKGVLDDLTAGRLDAYAALIPYTAHVSLVEAGQSSDWAEYTEIQGNQASAVESLRTINTAAITYEATYNCGFPKRLETLGPPPAGHETAAGADLMDQRLAGGRKSGYTFTYRAGAANGKGCVLHYTVNADPIKPGVTGERHYFTDDTNVIRERAGRPADRNSPAVEE